MVSKKVIHFAKYQALGNDFILIDCRSQEVSNPQELSRSLCRRKLGVGADGLILLLPDPEYQARMAFFNPDGSRSAMCGNGLRCLARHIAEENPELRSFTVRTDAGPRLVEVGSKKIRASLGKPSFDTKVIPLSQDLDPFHLQIPGAPLPPAVALSVGNPHCVFFLNHIEGAEIPTLGKFVENHRLFPEKTNVEFAHVAADNKIYCRVWERGAGETQSCGSGAAAVTVAAIQKGLVKGKAQVLLPGGSIEASWKPGGEVFIEGPAELVFKGSVTVP